jgi:hypothetical protein
MLAGNHPEMNDILRWRDEALMMLVNPHRGVRKNPSAVLPPEKK